MGGRIRLPSGFNPVSKSLMIAASPRRGRPARAGASSAQSEIGRGGLKSSFLPWSQRERSRSPCSFRGVWQSPHMPTFSTRYSPRETGFLATACGVSPLCDRSPHPEIAIPNNRIAMHFHFDDEESWSLIPRILPDLVMAALVRMPRRPASWGAEPKRSTPETGKRSSLPAGIAVRDGNR